MTSFIGRALIPAAALLLSGCVAVDLENADLGDSDADVAYFGSEPINGVSLPFSKAVTAGNTIYLAGELGIDPETRTLVPGGAGPETSQIFRNIEATLMQLDADLSDLVKCTVFVADMSTYAEMNAAYSAALPNPKPARATVAVSGLAFDAALEIDCIAVKD